MNGQLSLRSVAFLDTNTLHYIGIYLEFAKEHNLFPLAKDVAENEKHAAAERVNELAEANLKKSLKQGLEIVHFLATRDLQVQYAPASELELLTGRTRGKAVVSAAKEGVPDRMWSRFPEREVRDRVTLADSSAIKATIDGLTSTLEESGIAVKARGHDLMNDCNGVGQGHQRVSVHRSNGQYHLCECTSCSSGLSTYVGRLLEGHRKLYSPPTGRLSL